MRRTLLLLAVVLAAFVIGSAPLTAAYTWQLTSFTETMISSEMGRMVAHPTDPNTIYLATTNTPDFLAGTIDPGDGLWRTTDKGQTWQTINDAVFPTTYNIMDVAVCASSPNVIYAATIQQGIFKSVNGGTSWTDVSGGFSYSGSGFPNSDWAVLAVAVDPTNANKVYISVGQVSGLDILNLSPSHPGFFYSHNGGATWVENNSGLPPRYDSIWDGKSHTAAAGSIVVLPQLPSYVLLGMVDLDVNTALLFGKTAESNAGIFVNTNSGVGSFSLINNGLPTGIQQSPELGGSLARISTSTMVLSNSTGSKVDLWASHVGLTFDLSLSSTLMVTRNKGLFFTQNGQWQARNNGLPYIGAWTDPSSTPDSTIKFAATYNMGNVAVGPGSANKICMSGSNRCDMGNAGSNNTKVYATTGSGLPSWLKTWDQGLDNSPTYGYSEANATYITFNADLSCAFATVRWTDAVNFSPLHGDNGVYRLVIKP